MAAPFPSQAHGHVVANLRRLQDQAFEAEMRADENLALQAERLLWRSRSPRNRFNRTRSFSG
jgi:hypothetical protein